jgi:hypothetical protein
MVDASGYVSFAGTMYRAGRSWRGKEVEVASLPVRCRWPIRAQSRASSRFATIGPKNTARSRPRAAGPASRARMRRTVPTSRPRRYAVGPRAEPVEVLHFLIEVAVIGTEHAALTSGDRLGTVKRESPKRTMEPARFPW